MKILCVKEIYGSPCFLKFTLHLVWISSLVLSPCGGLKVPILIIHLSSMSFSLWHSEHLQATPPPWPTSASFSSEVTIESRRVQVRCLTSPVPHCALCPALSMSPIVPCARGDITLVLVPVIPGLANDDKCHQHEWGPASRRPLCLIRSRLQSHNFFQIRISSRVIHRGGQDSLSQGI